MGHRVYRRARRAYPLSPATFYQSRHWLPPLPVCVAVGPERPAASLAKKSQVTFAAELERLMMRTLSTKFSPRAPVAFTVTGR